MLCTSRGAALNLRRVRTRVCLTASSRRADTNASLLWAPQRPRRGGLPSSLDLQHLLEKLTTRCCPSGPSSRCRATASGCGFSPFYQLKVGASPRSRARSPAKSSALATCRRPCTRRGCSWDAGRGCCGPGRTASLMCRRRIGVPGRDLYIAEADLGVEHGRDEGVSRAQRYANPTSPRTGHRTESGPILASTAPPCARRPAEAPSLRRVAVCCAGRAGGQEGAAGEDEGG